MRLLRLALILAVLPIRAFADDPVTSFKDGQWGLSRIVMVDGGWTTAAMVQEPKLADSIEAHYPPYNNGSYPAPFALVMLQGHIGTPDIDTILFPQNRTSTRLGDISANQRTLINAKLEELLPAYMYKDSDRASIQVQAFSTSGYDMNTTFHDIIRDIFSYLANSSSRKKRTIFASHNTEYTDGFSTDPSSRWTAEVGSFGWDSGNEEMDVEVGTDSLFRYSANEPGDIEQEAQSTGSTTSNRLAGAAVRIANDGTNDGYIMWTAASTFIERVVAGVRTTIKTGAVVTLTSGDWYTQRLSAEGTSGSNVVINAWVVDHNASKPSDPGWVGIVGSPDITFTDTNAARMDDGSINLQGGIGSRASAASGFATGEDFFKVRTIADRSGGAAGPTPFRRRVMVTQ